MSEDDKKSPQGFGANSAIFVALFATGAYFYAQQAPLTVLRPPPIEIAHRGEVSRAGRRSPTVAGPFRYGRASNQESRSRGKEGMRASASDEESADTSATLPIAARSIEGENLRSELESARDHRRHGARRAPISRTAKRVGDLRYAVLSGLHLEGYEPRNEQHIGYFRPREHERNGLPVAVPYEWFDRRTHQIQSRYFCCGSMRMFCPTLHDPLTKTLRI